MILGTTCWLPEGKIYNGKKGLWWPHVTWLGDTKQLLLKDASTATTCTIIYSKFVIFASTQMTMMYLSPLCHWGLWVFYLSWWTGGMGSPECTPSEALQTSWLTQHTCNCTLLIFFPSSSYDRPQLCTMCTWGMLVCSHYMWLLFHKHRGSSEQWRSFLLY